MTRDVAGHYSMSTLLVYCNLVLDYMLEKHVYILGVDVDGVYAGRVDTGR
jgi:hypothetical protein